MAKKNEPAPVSEDPKKTKRRQVELDQDIARKVGVIASALDMSIPDYINNRLRPIIERDLPLALKELGLGGE